MRDIGDEVVLGLLRLDDELLFVGDLLHLPVGVVVHAVHERRQRFELGAGRRDALSPRRVHRELFDGLQDGIRQKIGREQADGKIEEQKGEDDRKELKYTSTSDCVGMAMRT